MNILHYGVEGGIRRIDILNRIDDICKWINEEKSLLYMQKELHCNYETLHKVLHHFNLEYRGHISKKGTNNLLNNGRKSAYEYLGTGKYITARLLKTKLIEEGIKEYKCERCGNSEWLGGKIPLELHHKNGNSFDNNLDNLEILCPNCHALTDNFKGKNRKNKKSKQESKYKKELNDLHERRLLLLYNSNIDFSKFGWVTEVGKLFGVKPQVASRYIREHFPNFYNQCYLSSTMKKQKTL